jgi:hypothetical protein
MQTLFTNRFQKAEDPKASNPEIEELEERIVAY